MIFGSLKLSFYACVCQTSPMCEVQCRRLLHQEGRALQSLEIRFFVLFWRRIIDFKKDETKKVFFVFAFDAPVSMMMNLLVSVSLFLSLALSLIVFLF